MSKTTRSRSSPRPTINRMDPRSILKKQRDWRVQSKQPKIPVRFASPKTRPIITELDFEPATCLKPSLCVHFEYNTKWQSRRLTFVALHATLFILPARDFI